MNLLKRLNNLWKLSEYYPTNPYAPSETGEVRGVIERPVKMAEIIRKKVDPLEKLNG